jgi:UDP-N-acetylmuramyl pentapeptide synthase
MRFRASEVAAAVGGQLHGPDVEIDGVSFDSRSVQPGQLFVPIVADRDGHEFIDGALDRGAVAFLSSQPFAGRGTAIEVPDTLRALMALAAARRSTFDGPVIGITGSVGKTSTKDLAWAALAASKRTWANERSFNNEQGLPTTLLNTPNSPTCSCWRWACAVSARSPNCAPSPGPPSGWSHALRRHTATASAASRAWRGQRLSSSKRFRPTVWHC